jgi:hypothetical protein
VQGYLVVAVCFLFDVLGGGSTPERDREQAGQDTQHQHHQDDVVRPGSRREPQYAT